MEHKLLKNPESSYRVYHLDISGILHRIVLKMTGSRHFWRAACGTGSRFVAGGWILQHKDFLLYSFG